MFNVRVYFLYIFIPLIGIQWVQGLSEEMQEMVDMLHNTCRDETGAAEDVISNAQKGTFTDDPKLKCYMKCLLVQMASMGDDGVIDTEGTIALLPEEFQETIAPTIRKCGSIQGADDCETAFLTNKCWLDNNKEHYFLI